jgi:hypothetical protein
VTQDNAFYVRLDDDCYQPIELTRGPWDRDAQHAGPPAALLGHAIEHRPGANGEMRVARISYDILQSVPLTPLRVATRVTHAGRRVEVVEATLTPQGSDRIVMRASATRVRVDPVSAPAHLPAATVPDPAGFPVTGIPMRFDIGYHTAMETRNVAGAFETPGPATVWFRMRHPLIAGEPIDPLSRALIAADSGNGVSGVLDLREYLFVNPELTVHLHRYPVGEWVCLDAVTHIDPAGIGLADTMLHDESGPIGRGNQSLYVARHL